jgi:hypothetical protein
MDHARDYRDVAPRADDKHSPTTLGWIRRGQETPPSIKVFGTQGVSLAGR